MKTNTEAVHRIHQLDLGCIKFKLMDAEEGKGWSRAKVDKVEILYKRFLILKAKNPSVSVVPTHDIDDMWHAHILDTAKYIDDCNEIFGFYLHHFPYLGMRGTEDRKNLEQAFATTREMFIREFGEDIVSEGEIVAWRMCGDSDHAGYSIASESSRMCGCSDAPGDSFAAKHRPTILAT